MCDPAMEYISEGMHDAIINELGNINSLLVKSKTATQNYLDSKLTGQQIANELGANIIVKESVVCTDEGMRLLVQLLQIIPEEKELWSNTYDLDLSKSITLQRDITKQIVKYVKANISTQEKIHLNTERPVNSELYKKYLQGVFYMNKLTRNGFEQGVRYLNDAVAIDPEDPLPYLGLALGYHNAGHESNVAADAPRIAKKYALKALELDSTLAEAYIILASDYIYEEWNMIEGGKALRHAIDINPNVALGRYHLSWYLTITEQFDEGEEEMKKAVEIDPLDPLYIGNLALLYEWTGNWKEAIPSALKTLELDPNYPMAYFALGCAYAELGMHDKSIETHKKGISISADYKHGLGVAYAHAGMKKEALEIAAELEKTNNPWYTWGLAEIFAALGDKEKTMQWIEVAYAQRHEFVVAFKTNSAFKIVYDDPRFQGIVNRFGLPG